MKENHIDADDESSNKSHSKEKILAKPTPSLSASKISADDRREASLKAKDKKSFTYDCFTNKSNSKLNEWLLQYKPTTVSDKYDDVGSLVIYGFDKDEEQLSRYKDKFEMGSAKSLEENASLIEEWKNITDYPTETVNYSTICKLAKKYRVLGGKWLFSAHRNFIDNLWSKICYEMNRATASISRLNKDKESGGKIEGLQCIAAKLSLGREEIEKVVTGRGDNKFMLMIYTTDFMDDKAILTVEKSLRKCGIKTQLSYKPDIFSILGIYRQNRFQLRPTIYQSRWISDPTGSSVGQKAEDVLARGESIIESCIGDLNIPFKEYSGIPSNTQETSNKFDLTSNETESTAPEGKGSLGRNIVLQVLKRKQSEEEKLVGRDVIKADSPLNTHKETSRATTPLWIGKIPKSVTDEMIKADLESKFGAVAKLERHSFCYVTFEEEKSGEKLLQDSLAIGGKANVCGNMLEVNKKRP